MQQKANSFDAYQVTEVLVYLAWGASHDVTGQSLEARDFLSHWGALSWPLDPTTEGQYNSHKNDRFSWRQP